MQRHIRYIITLSMLGLALTGSGCASKKKNTAEPTEQAAEVLYNEAMDMLEQKRYGQAAEKFEHLEQEQPYSRWAIRAEIMAAYAYYRQAKYDDALLAIERFVKLHPGNEDAPYAYYLRGLCYYDQITDVG